MYMYAKPIKSVMPCFNDFKQEFIVQQVFSLMVIDGHQLINNKNISDWTSDTRTWEYLE